MASIVAAALSSHAYAFESPYDWDARRERSRNNFARRYGREAPACPEAETESLEEDVARFAAIRDGLETVRERFNALAPDLLIIIGDDQDENFVEANLPQLAIFTGAEFVAVDPKSKSSAKYRNDVAFARHLLDFGVEHEFDIASASSFNGDRLISHAHREPITYLGAADRYCVLPVFFNGIHVPAPSPARCYAFGRMLRDAIEHGPASMRVALYASGGMSHYSPGFPWDHYSGSNTIGSVSAAFDREVMDMIRSGQGAKTAALSSQALLENGDVEMRAAIILAGVMGSSKPAFLNYEPFHRGIMGMADRSLGRERIRWIVRRSSPPGGPKSHAACRVWSPACVRGPNLFLGNSRP